LVVEACLHRRRRVQNGKAGTCNGETREEQRVFEIRKKLPYVPAAKTGPDIGRLIVGT